MNLLMLLSGVRCRYCLINGKAFVLNGNTCYKFRMLMFEKCRSYLQYRGTEENNMM